MAFGFGKLRNWLIGPAKTATYQQYVDSHFQRIRDLPLFTRQTIQAMLVDPTIRLGLAMRAAPLYQAEFAWEQTGADGIKRWMPGILADKPEVGRYVLRQLKRIWQCDLGKILTAQTWGWSAGEVTYRLRDEQVHIDRLMHRHAIDVFPLMGQGEVKAVRFKRLKGDVGQLDLRFPKVFWHAFFPEGESPFGWSILKGAHSPWADKWMDGGALDVRRLFAHKDAYGGVTVGYPAGTLNIDGKGEVPTRDVAREMAEQLKSGGVVTKPTERDAAGNERWTVERATIPASPTHIFEFPKDLDLEMLRGMEIPDEVLISQMTGAWQGKQVPMLAFFTAADRWLFQVIEMLVTQILEPMVLLNFGRAEDFQITTKPLAEQAMEQMQGGEQDQQQSRPGTPGTAPSDRQPPVAAAGGAQRFNLDLAGPTEQGATEVIQSTRRFVDANLRERRLVSRYAQMCGLDAAETKLLKVLVNGEHTAA